MKNHERAKIRYRLGEGGGNAGRLYLSQRPFLRYVGLASEKYPAERLSLHVRWLARSVDDASLVPAFWTGIMALAKVQEQLAVSH